MLILFKGILVRRVGWVKLVVRTSGHSKASIPGIAFHTGRK